MCLGGNTLFFSWLVMGFAVFSGVGSWADVGFCLRTFSSVENMASLCRCVLRPEIHLLGPLHIQQWTWQCSWPVQFEFYSLQVFSLRGGFLSFWKMTPGVSEVLKGLGGCSIFGSSWRPWWGPCSLFWLCSSMFANYSTQSRVFAFGGVLFLIYMKWNLWALKITRIPCIFPPLFLQSC